MENYWWPLSVFITSATFYGHGLSIPAFCLTIKVSCAVAGVDVMQLAKQRVRERGLPVRGRVEEEEKEEEENVY